MYMAQMWQVREQGCGMCRSIGVAFAVGIFDQTYSCLTRVVQEVLTLYTHPLTVGYSSVEFVTRIISHLESFERTQLNSYMCMARVWQVQEHRCGMCGSIGVAFGIDR
jgi:hypothetical protein